MTLLALVPTWITSWLTPIWLVSLGIFGGLLLLAVIWLILAALSRIPALGNPAISPHTRNQIGWILAGIFTVLLLGVTVAPHWSDWAAEGNDVLMENATVRLLLSGILGFLLGQATIHLTSRRAVDETAAAIREGVLWPIFILACVLSVFAFAGALIAQDPTAILASLSRVPNVGAKTYEFQIEATDFEALGAASDPTPKPIETRFRVSELKELVFESDQSLTISSEAGGSVDLDPDFRITDDEAFTYRNTDEELGPFESPAVDTLYVRNYGGGAANLKVTVVTQPADPEVLSIVITATGLVAIFLLYMLQRTALPRTSAVALSTLKSEIAQPLFAIIMCIGVVLLILFIFIPYNTFGEDIKMLKDSGMTLIMVLCIIQAIWASSTSLADEIDGRTALTVLSKPIGRRAFIVGKFLGIGWTVAFMFLVFGLVLLIVVAYKPLYDAKEGAENEPIWQMCHLEMIGVIPGLVLAFMETLVLAALSVAIATRLPMLANFLLCFTIYVLGHLTPLLVQSSVGQFEAVGFVANLLATILPILDHFNIQAAIAAGITVPLDYLGWSLVYCLIYGMIALLLALVLFEDRDLA